MNIARNSPAQAAPGGKRRLCVLVAGKPGPLNEYTRDSFRRSGLTVLDADANDWFRPDVWRPDLDVVVVGPQFPFHQVEGLLAEWTAAELPIPVLVMSGCDAVACLHAGADDHVPPTAELREVIARVHALTRRNKQADSVLRVGDLVIETMSRTVTRAGRAIRLTVREYDLLKFLVFHRGHVVLRGTIERQVFEGSGDCSNLVAVYIRYLRRKIDFGFNQPLLQTHWGQGYSIRTGGKVGADSTSMAG